MPNTPNAKTIDAPDERLLSPATLHAQARLSGCVPWGAVVATGNVDGSDELGADDAVAVVVVPLGDGVVEAGGELLELLGLLVVDGVAVALVELELVEGLLLVPLVVGSTVTVESSDDAAVLLVLGSTAAVSLGSPLVSVPPSPGPVNFHQLNLNPPPVKRRKRSCLPSAPLMLHDCEAHVCAPPVAATVHVPTSVPSSASKCSSTAPGFAAATRSSNAVAPSPNATSFSLM